MAVSNVQRFHCTCIVVVVAVVVVVVIVVVVVVTVVVIAIVIIITYCRPFTVSPAIFTLKPKDCLQVEIGFNPTLIGDHNDELVIEYDTGKQYHLYYYPVQKGLSN